MIAIRRTMMLFLAVIIAVPAFAKDECARTLSGSQEVPPNDSPNSGTAQLHLTGRVLHFDISWTGLSGDFAGTHFHSGTAGENGSVMFDIGPFVEGNGAEGIWVMTDDQLDALEAGHVYLNVHSATYPGGEIRAQLDCGFHVSPHHGGEDTCVVALSGEAEIPPNDSPTAALGCSR